MNTPELKSDGMKDLAGEFRRWYLNYIQGTIEKLNSDDMEISYHAGHSSRQPEIDILLDKVKRYEEAMVHIHKMGCAYKGNLTGCPACYICNEFPEFNEMNKRDRSDHGNN